ncbi:MAG: rhomboid family intramembrane serine protease, partial [Planctomycetia bacterium]
MTEQIDHRAKGRTEGPRRRPVTWGVFAVWAALFAAAAWWSNGLDFAGGVLEWGAVREESLVALGALSPALVGNADAPFGVGQWQRLATAALLHASLIHIAFNTLGLLALGRVIEPLYGGGTLLAVFGFGSLAANGCSLAWHRQELEFLQVGGSGGVFALAGFLTASAWMLRDRLGPRPYRRMAVVLVLGLVFVFDWNAVDHS